jgi:hypothetical protein
VSCVFLLCHHICMCIVCHPAYRPLLTLPCSFAGIHLTPCLPPPRPSAQARVYLSSSLDIVCKYVLLNLQPHLLTSNRGQAYISRCLPASFATCQLTIYAFVSILPTCQVLQALNKVKMPVKSKFERHFLKATSCVRQYLILGILR